MYIFLESSFYSLWKIFHILSSPVGTELKLFVFNLPILHLFKLTLMPTYFISKNNYKPFNNF